MTAPDTDTSEIVVATAPSPNVEKKEPKEKEYPKWLERWNDKGTAQKQPVLVGLTDAEIKSLKEETADSELVEVAIKRTKTKRVPLIDEKTNKQVKDSKGRKQYEKVKEPYWTHKKTHYVETYEDFRFLGQSFRGGITKELVAILTDAQETLYDEYVSRKGKKPNERQFKTWGGLNSQNIGWRHHQTSYHNKGTAFDIAARDNPYVAAGTLEKPCGEKHKSIPWEDNKKLFKKALEVYQKATDVVVGNGAEINMEPRKSWSGEDVAKVYDRMKTVNDNVVAYLHLVFITAQKHNQLNKDTIPGHSVISLPTLIQRAIENRNNPMSIIGKFVIEEDKSVTSKFEEWLGNHPYAHTREFVTEYEEVFHGGSCEIPYPIVEDSDYSNTWWPEPYMLQDDDRHQVFDRLIDLYYSVIDDHETLRWVMVNGKITKDKLKASKLPSTRDPCCGFLNMRKEVVVAIVNAMDNWAKKHSQRKSLLRWGACDFGINVSGDIMHFDISKCTIDPVELEKSTVGSGTKSASGGNSAKTSA